ncbi:MAG: glycosyltransferase family 4 protein [Deltaproteobacteria bacterium]|nr:glycosyltransferase family 4 protein [Deltaproteobacteria bacterium]
MRILFVNKASLTHEGGAEIRTREIGKRLAALGHDVVVLAAKTGPREPPWEMLDGMRLYHKKVLPDWLVKRFPAPNYLPLAAANLFLMFHLWRFLKKETFDLIREDCSPFPPSFLLAFFRLKTKRFAVVHNLPGNLKGWIRAYGLLYGLPGFWMDRMLRAGHLKYDRIVCAAKWLADELQGSPKVADRVRYVPNGIDLDRFAAVRKERAERKDTRLLSVGRLVEMKGLRYLIAALAHVQRDDPDVTLTILGKGPLRDALIRQAGELRVEGRMEIRPPVPHGDMPGVYRQFDFLVLPSLTEGFPITLLEAMAIRLPIIASDIPGVTGILDGRSATLFASGNAQDLSEKLRWAIEHPEEVVRKTQTALAIAKRYHWDIVAEQELDEGMKRE